MGASAFLRLEFMQLQRTKMRQSHGTAFRGIVSGLFSMALIYGFVDVTLSGDPVFGLTPAEISENSMVDSQARSTAFLNDLEGPVPSQMMMALEQSMIAGTQFTAVNSMTGTEGDSIDKSGWVLNFEGQYGGINENAPSINDEAMDDAEFLAEVEGAFLDEGTFQHLLYRKSES